MRRDLITTTRPRERLPGLFFWPSKRRSRGLQEEAPMSADHRQLGRELGLFRTDQLVGAGLPLWLPDGAIVRSGLERLPPPEAVRGRGQPVYTPVLAKREL